MWDATCPDTLTSSYRCQAISAAGKVASAAEEKKACKYAVLQAYCFMPVAIETLGAFGPKTLSFMKELGRRIMVETGDKRACRHLLQRLSVAVQRVNAAATLRTCLDTSPQH